MPDLRSHVYVRDILPNQLDMPPIRLLWHHREEQFGVFLPVDGDPKIHFHVANKRFCGGVRSGCEAEVTESIALL